MIQNLLDNLNLTGFDILSFAIRLLVILFSVSFHEASHALRAYRLGDDTAQRAGRLTLNPMAHIDPMGALVMILSRARIGWAKPVPINPVLFTRAKTMKRGIVEVSLAGPGSNLLLSIIAYFLLKIVLLANYAITGGYYYYDPLSMTISGAADPGYALYLVLILLISLFSLNVFLAVFNLLPVPPLDGYKIFGSLLPGKWYYRIMEYERYIGLVFIAVIFFAGSYFSSALYTVATPFIYIISKPLDLLFGLLEKIFF